MKRQPEPPRYVKVKEYLLEKIKKMTPGDTKLEPENLLTAKLGISRETIRKAMGLLIQEGIITRWHGKGNFGHPSVCTLSMRIDINSDFRRLLRNAGYRVKTIRSKPVPSKPSPQMLKRIPEAAGEKTIAYNLVFHADDRPAILVNVELLEKHVARYPESGEYKENIIDALKEYCNVDYAYPTAWQRAGIIPDTAVLFKIPEDTPLLIWDEVYHDLLDFKIGYSEIIFNPEIMDISMKLSF